MISLHITIYQTTEGDRFKVFFANASAPDDLQDVTDQYEVAAVRVGGDGREGFAVVKRPFASIADESTRHEGTEL